MLSVVVMFYEAECLSVAEAMFYGSRVVVLFACQRKRNNKKTDRL